MDFTYEYVKTLERAQQCIAELNEATHVVLDIETTGLDRFNDKIVSFQLCSLGARNAYYFDAEYVYLLKKLESHLVLHNFKFDFAFLFQQGIDLRDVDVPGFLRWSDTMLMHHLLDENAQHSLDSIVKAYYHDNYKEVFWSKYKSFEEASIEDKLEYSCKDVIYTGLIYINMEQELSVSGVPQTLIDHVHKLAAALYDTEVRGVRVDLDYLTKIGNDLSGKIANAKTEMMKLAPEHSLVELDMWLEELDKRKTEKGRAGVPKPEFNWDSNKQLQALIYGKLELPAVTKYDKTSKSHKPTLNDDALVELEGMHSIVKELSEYRGNQKVFTSFIQGTLEIQRGGVVYPSFNVNGAKTGRISHSSPNLAQLPADGGVRGIYVPTLGHCFISADYGMIEVVVAAHYSDDPSLLKMIYEGVSKHDLTSKSLKIARPLAKRFNFAVGYGATEFKIAKILECSIQEAKGALNKYWETYAGEKKIIDECRRKVDAGVDIVGLYGRRRRFPSSFKSKNERESTYRQAYNSLIQGSASDITHESYYKVHSYLGCNGAGRAVVEIHDQVLAEAKKEKAEEALAGMVEIMVEVGKSRLKHPLKVDPQGPMDRWED